MIIEAGDIFYTKEIQMGIKPGAPKMKLKKHAIAIILGIANKAPPTKTEIIQLLVNGPNLIRLDDIVEVFGEKNVDDKLIPFLKETYK